MRKFEGKRIVYLYIDEIFEDNLMYLKDNGAILTLLTIKELPLDWEYRKYFDNFIKVDNLDFNYLIKTIDFSNVDGVISVFKENESPLVKRLNEYIGHKYIFTNKQFKNFSNKVRFRKICEKYNVPTPKTYFRGSLFSIWKLLFVKFKYPLIIKPADLLGGSTIKIVKEKSFFLFDLLRAFKYSHSLSAIIEEYIESDELCITYVVKDKKPTLSSIFDRYLFKDNQVIPRPFMEIFPSKYINEFINSVDKKIKNMLVQEKLNNVSVFFQAKYKDGKFYIFESGLRLDGGYCEFVNSEINKQNFVQFLIDNVLGVKTDFLLEKEDPFLKGKIVVNYCQIVNPGIIKSQDGIDAIKENDSIFWKQYNHKVGDEIYFGSFLGNVVDSFYIKGDKIEEIIPVIKEINSKIKIIDTNNKDMINKNILNFNVFDKYKTN